VGGLLKLSYMCDTQLLDVKTTWKSSSKCERKCVPVYHMLYQSLTKGCNQETEKINTKFSSVKVLKNNFHRGI
jgi:hypothetical protein